MSDNATPLFIVSGNRSGDLDSLISSYVKAELIRRKAPAGEVYPIRYFSDNNWKLHRDAWFLMEQCGADPDRFVSIDVVPALSKGRDVNLYLTDHNTPEKELSGFRDCIVEIVDHHRVSDSLPENIRCRVENTGSSSTLLAEELLSEVENNPRFFPEKILKSLCEMLYFTIRMDTDHLTDREQYNLDKDHWVLGKLKHFVKKNDDFTALIQAKKDDFSSFSVEDFLEKDFKLWFLPSLTYGMSTIHGDIEKFFQLFGPTVDTAAPFMKKNKLDVLFLMHFVKAPILKRELTVICSEHCAFKDKLAEGIEDSGLFLKQKRGSREYFRYFQNNPHLSRKKIQPFINDLLINITEDD